MKPVVGVIILIGAMSLTGCNREPETVVVNQPTSAPQNNKVIIRPKPATPAPKVVVVPQKKTTTVQKESHTVTVVATPTPPAAPAKTPRSEAKAPTPRSTKTPVPRVHVRPTPTPRPKVAARPTPPKKPSPVAEQASSKQKPLIVNAEVVKTSAVPNPSSVPYADSLVFIKYKVVSVAQGKYDQPEILVAHWGMKAKKLLPPARYQVGQTLRLQIEPLDDHPELERIMRNDDTEAFELNPYWAVRAD